MIERRQFIALVGGAAAAWPLTARAQQQAMPVIGFLSGVSASVTSKRISSFGQGLSDTGYTVGRDVTVEARMAEGQDDRLPALAADLVSGHVRLIAASGPSAAFVLYRGRGRAAVSGQSVISGGRGSIKNRGQPHAKQFSGLLQGLSLRAVTLKSVDAAQWLLPCSVRV
jgi:hypothetical protein